MNEIQIKFVCIYKEHQKHNKKFCFEETHVPNCKFILFQKYYYYCVVGSWQLSIIIKNRSNVVVSSSFSSLIYNNNMVKPEVNDVKMFKEGKHFHCFFFIQIHNMMTI